MSDEGQYFTNRDICKLAFKLAYDIKKNLRREDGTLCTFADWFCGTGGFPAEFVKGVKANLPSVDWKKDSGSVYCQDMNLSSVTTTLLNMLILTGIPFSGEKIRGSNSFSEPIISGTGAPFKNLALDYCFMNPPYGGDKSKGKEYKFAYSKKIKGEDGSTTKKFFVNHDIQSIGIEDDDKVSAGVQLAMATLSADGGVCSIVLPQGFFFGASKKCVELRKKIAEEYKIWYVVDIASGSFLNTGTKTSMMVFQKGVGPTEKVAFIGLDEKPLMEATLSELQAKHYSLNYKQYLPQSAVEVEGFDMVKLGDIAKSFTFGYGIKSADFGESGMPIIKTKNFKGNEVLLLENNPRTTGTYKEEYRIKKGDLLVVIDGACGDFGFWNNQEDGWLNQHVAKIDFENELTKKFVYYSLFSPAYRAHICSETVSTTIAHMPRDTIKNYKIPLPSLERQQQIVEAIDGWARLAQQEELSLKILEKQMMFQVKEMGRRHARVKLGEVCEFQKKPGKLGRADGKESGKFPFYTCAQKKMYVDSCEFTKTCLIVNRGGIMNVRIDRNFSISHDDIHVLSYNDTTTTEIGLVFIYYYLKGNMDVLENGMNGSVLQHLNKSFLAEVEIPLPPLTEQQTLQSDFDEIRHKHAKIAAYKAKAQEAIQRLIPGAIPV